MTWYTETVSIDNVTLHYRRNFMVPNDKTTLVFLHGLTDSGACWLSIANHFRDSYNILIPDARGHGHSEMPRNGFDYDSLASDVFKLIKNLEIKSNVLIGHSMGAMTALRYATIYPDQIRAQVLEDPVFIFFTDDKRKQFQKKPREKGLLGFLSQISDKSLDKIMKLGKQRYDWPEAEYEPWAKSKLQFMSKNPDQFISEMDKETKWEQELSQVSCPTLVLYAQNSLIEPKAAQRAERLINNGAIVNLGEAGHNIRRELPEKFISTLKSFLDKITE